MVLRTLDRFFAAETITEVILVVAPSDISRCEGMLRQEPQYGRRRWLVQRGGATRQQSVQNGLQLIDPKTDIIVIHDGARPFIIPSLIDRCVEEANEKGAAVIGVRARDTIKVVSEDRWVQGTLARSSLWEIQTPQSFHRDIILEAHARAASEQVEATDDAALVERLGHPVFVVEGERLNFKITVPQDVWLAEALIREGKVF
jgi:2-C-methyl-D-erythritol 4-phosphate cytidylyltransferase